MQPPDQQHPNDRRIRRASARVRQETEMDIQRTCVTLCRLSLYMCGRRGWGGRRKVSTPANPQYELNHPHFVPWGRRQWEIGIRLAASEALYIRGSAQTIRPDNVTAFPELRIEEEPSISHVCGRCFPHQYICIDRSVHKFPVRDQTSIKCANNYQTNLHRREDTAFESCVYSSTNDERSMRAFAIN